MYADAGIMDAGTAVRSRAMSDSIDPRMRELTALLRERVNILTIDNQEENLVSQRDLFRAPVFRVQSAGSTAEAQRTIRAARDPWHCWIVDQRLDGVETGLDLVRKFPYYPFCVLATAYGDLELGMHAREAGVMLVVDRRPPMALHRLYERTCNVAALGFLAGGVLRQGRSVLEILVKREIRSVDQWLAAIAEKQPTMNDRSLRRICEAHLGMPPALAVAGYYCLKKALMLNGDFGGQPGDLSKTCEGFVERCFETVKEVIAEKAQCGNPLRTSQA